MFLFSNFLSYRQRDGNTGDPHTIENTKCQNDKIIFIFCRYQPQKYFPIFFLFSFFIVKFAIEARKCP